MDVQEIAHETLLVLADQLLRIQSHSLQAPLREALRSLRQGTDVGALANAWADGEAAALLAELDALGWLTSEPIDASLDFAGETYERQLDYLGLFTPDTAAAQRRLLSARVGILGLGGVGGLVAQHLVAAGVGTFHLVDDDTVAKHNLNRQFTYAPEDVGAPKTEALARYLRRVRPEAEVTGYRRRITDEAGLDAVFGPGRRLDLLVLAADVPSDLPATVARWAAVTGTPFSMGAVGVGTGFWGPLVDPSRGGCWDCFERARRAALTEVEREVESGATEPAPFSFGPSNTTVAAMLAHDIIQYLCSGRCPTSGRRAALDFTQQHITHTEESTCTCQTT
ncbi:HesA/MoeB/ThiF family protein [Streptomyces diastaticus]|uniref:HesA/MoeB/ThiF family protein n=1 Tax=Streptomyces TaxID=1883 RepID=UPI000FB19F89|nr:MULTISPECIES: ThiF family adenylyltransferase [Streptomyces]NEE35308.1 ThiF family adenylyltransferase [Streptomyces sp. SID7982]RPK86892.1 Sulfur carrier protein ThiS adenylyltransferase [Streptomyces sp. ADI98-12]